MSLPIDQWFDAEHLQRSPGGVQKVWGETVCPNLPVDHWHLPVKIPVVEQAVKVVASLDVVTDEFVEEVGLGLDHFVQTSTMAPLGPELLQVYVNASQELLWLRDMRQDISKLKQKMELYVFLGGGSFCSNQGTPKLKKLAKLTDFSKFKLPERKKQKF